jgi:hypothetical protein
VLENTNFRWWLLCRVLLVEIYTETVPPMPCLRATLAIRGYVVGIRAAINLARLENRSLDINWVVELASNIDGYLLLSM